MYWLLSNLHIAQTRTYRDTHSFCFLDAYPQVMVLSRTPLPLPYSCPSTNKTRRRNQQASYHCSPINTIHSIARSVHQRLRHTYSEQIPHRTHTQRSLKARSPNSLLHISQRDHNSLTNRETTPHTWIEILSLKDLVAQEIRTWSSDWFFPINNIISLRIHRGLFSKVLHRRRRVSPGRPMYLLMVGLDYCVMRFTYALHMRRQNLVLLSCLSLSLPFLL